MKKTIVMYHSNCVDGLFAAYAVWLGLNKDNTIFISVGYGDFKDKPPKEALEIVLARKEATANISLRDYELYVLDFACPVEHVNYYTSIFKGVLVLDHHTSSEKDYAKHFPEIEGCYWGVEGTLVQDVKVYRLNDNSDACDKNIAIFARDMSGALLTYDWFFSAEEVPDYFKWVSDRDLWTFKYSETKPFHAGIQALNYGEDFKRLHQDLQDNISGILDVGKVYTDTVNKRIDQLAKTSAIEVKGKFHISGIGLLECVVMFINSSLDIASDLCDYFVNSDNRPMLNIAVAYYINNKGEVRCSIRSNKYMKALGVAKKFGGGGHERAAGFSMSLKDLTTILETKTLELHFDKSDTLVI